MDISVLKPDENNARVHNPRNIQVIVDALQKVGAGRSILIDENNKILCGNGVIEAAGIAGIDGLKIIDADGSEIVAIRRKNLTEEQKMIMSIADNRAAELSTWDVDILKDLDVDLSWMFSDDDLESIFKDREETKEKSIKEDIPVEVGDVFTIDDNHRLMCGDCYNSNDVNKLITINSVTCFAEKAGLGDWLLIAQNKSNKMVIGVDDIVKHGMPTPDSILILDTGTGYYDPFLVYGDHKGRTMFTDHDDLLATGIGNNKCMYVPFVSYDVISVIDNIDRTCFGMNDDPMIISKILKSFDNVRKV